MKTSLVFIVSIFVLLSFQAVFAQANKAKVSQGGVCNGNAIYLPKPEYLEEAKSQGIKGTVSVQILIDKNGDVESAKALSNHSILRKEAEKAALKTKFRQTFSSGKPVKISCVLVYVFSPKEFPQSDSQNQNRGGKNTKGPRTCGGGICNSRATYFPQPVYPKEAKEKNITGSVSIIVSIDEEGNVTSAEPCGGHPLLQEEARKAALKAKFKQTKLSGVPVKVSCGLLYTFLPDKTKQSEQIKEKPQPYFEPPIISLGIINDNAKILLMPKLGAVQPQSDGSINVEVKIDLQKGKVISAMAFEGHPLIRDAAVKAAMQAEFEPILTEFSTIYGKGTLVYKFEDFNGKSIENKTPKPFPIIKRGVLNDLAKFIPEPEIPNAAICAGGNVEATVLVNSNGEVIFAKAVSGDAQLYKLVEEEALRVRFSPVNGSVPVYVLGKIIFKFPISKCVKGGTLNEKAIVLPKPNFDNIFKSNKLKLTNIESVSVLVEIDENGNVTSAKTAAGHPLLRPEAEKAAMKAKFKSTILSGEIVKIRGVIVYKIKPNGEVEF